MASSLVFDVEAGAIYFTAQLNAFPALQNVVALSAGARLVSK